MMPHASTDKPLYGVSSSLDLLSISPTEPTICDNHAPFIAYQTASKRWAVTQGCCNNWTCARCGDLRARAEYGRIVEGCRKLELEHELYFVTITSPGKPMTPARAIKSWLDWTNRLLDALRINGKRRGIAWAYAGVTEFQKRGHPHSHYLMTWYPHDLEDGLKVTTIQLRGGGRVTGSVDALRSDWLRERCISAGVGEQYDISQVFTSEGASRYVAKYLFKQSMFSADYPKNWNRVRYSQSFPKLQEKSSNGFPLLSRADWQLLARKAAIVDAVGQVAYHEARYNLRGSDSFVNLKAEPVKDKRAC